jgi:hypothetical protein
VTTAHRALCRRLGALAIVPFLVASSAAAQCRPPARSHEARLLAFYEAPLVFSIAGAPERVTLGDVRVGVEAGSIPSPHAALQQPEFCYQPHTENTRLAAAFGRPRVTVGLPAGFALDASYLPPVTIGGATPNLGSVALSRVTSMVAAGLQASVSLRAHTTFGSVRGAITCSASALQSADPTAPCYGTRPSRDTFRPGMVGGDGALGIAGRGGRLALYAGGGVTWLRPRFQVGFTDAVGTLDTTRVEVKLVRGSVFGGITARVTRALAISSEVYSVPADATTLRVAAQYRLR